MGATTNISWSGATWNAVIGCSHVSEGCRFCYAETLALKFGWSAVPWTAPYAARNVVLKPARLREPTKWAAPRMVFVNSLSDFFHEQIPDEYRDRMMATMLDATRHTYQILTKRPERMRAYCDDWCRRNDLPALPRHIWLGVSVEEDRWCDRVAPLLAAPVSGVRFVSAEPLLGPLPSLCLAGIDWLIVGGESGAGPAGRKLVERCSVRALHRAGNGDLCTACGGTGWEPVPWATVEARRLRDLAAESGTAFHFKQWGGPVHSSGGHLLDGKEYRAFPEVAPAEAVQRALL